MKLTETNINEIVFTTTNHTGVFTDTLKIAEAFDRRHADVMKIVRRLVKNKALGRGNISLSSYTTKQNKTADMYLLDKKSFLVLALSFTGADADRLKGKFVDLFLHQEQELVIWRKSRETLKMVHPSYTDQVKLVSEMLKMEGSKQSHNLYSTIQRQINKAVTHKSTPRGADHGEYREKLSTEHLEEILWFENSFVSDMVEWHINRSFNGRYIRNFIKVSLHNYYRNTAA